MATHTDKLAEMFKKHRLHGYALLVPLCQCGHEGDHDRHLADIVRGYLRTRKVVALAPDSHDQFCDCRSCTEPKVTEKVDLVGALKASIEAAQRRRAAK